MKLVVLTVLVIILFIIINTITRREHFSNNKKMAVLIHTFDGYSRYWKPLLHFTNKYLNIDYDIYIGVEDMDIPKEVLGKVKILKSGKGSFIDRLESHLSKLEKMGYKYIYIMQEDHWYTSNKSYGVDNKKIFNDAIDMMDRNNIDCLKLHVLSMHHFNTNTSKKFHEKLANKNLYYMNPKNIGISHNGCIATLKLLKHSCNITKLKGWSTAKGHEYATYIKEFGKIKQSGDDKEGLKIIQTAKRKPILQFEHVGYGGSLNKFGKNILIKEGKTHWISKINSTKNQVKKRQEIK
jgi:hypothetical protein